jgi:hypothetical protein
MKNTTNYKRGQKVTYQKEIMFKGTETVTATIVAIKGRVLLLDNGDTILVY